MSRDEHILLVPDFFPGQEIGQPASDIRVIQRRLFTAEIKVAGRKHRIGYNRIFVIYLIEHHTVGRPVDITFIEAVGDDARVINKNNPEIRYFNRVGIPVQIVPFEYQLVFFFFLQVIRPVSQQRRILLPIILIEKFWMDGHKAVVTEHFEKVARRMFEGHFEHITGLYFYRYRIGVVIHTEPVVFRTVDDIEQERVFRFYFRVEQLEPRVFDMFSKYPVSVPVACILPDKKPVRPLIFGNFPFSGHCGGGGH